MLEGARYADFNSGWSLRLLGGLFGLGADRFDVGRDFFNHPL